MFELRVYELALFFFHKSVTCVNIVFMLIFFSFSEYFFLGGGGYKQIVHVQEFTSLYLSTMYFELLHRNMQNAF